MEHFEEFLNKRDPMNTLDTKATLTNLSIVNISPTIEEISVAIRQIKIGKAAGPDNIPTGRLNSDRPHSIQKDLGRRLSTTRIHNYLQLTDMKISREKTKAMSGDKGKSKVKIDNTIFPIHKINCKLRWSPLRRRSTHCSESMKCDN